MLRSRSSRPSEIDPNAWMMMTSDNTRSTSPAAGRFMKSANAGEATCARRNSTTDDIRTIVSAVRCSTSDRLFNCTIVAPMPISRSRLQKARNSVAAATMPKSAGDNSRERSAR
ncbi:hypothetical protein D3C87_1672790 [compost metagenome]